MGSNLGYLNDPRLYFDLMLENQYIEETKLMPNLSTEENQNKKRDKKPYNKRTDIERIASQWRRIGKLHDLDEYSSAIIRCAIAAEIAANHAIRTEFRLRGFSENATDEFLRWANGLDGKMTRLLKHTRFSDETDKVIYERLRTLSTSIATVRNKIAHSGTFSTSREARKAVSECKKFIETLVSLYDNSFSLPPHTN